MLFRSYLEDFHWRRDIVGESEWREPSAYAGRVLLLLQTLSHVLFQRDVPLFCQGKNLKLVSNMPDSNRNWKSRYFFVEGTDWVCHEEEWATMPRGYFDNTWAFVKESS